MRKKRSREKQAEEQKSHIRELDGIYRADGRANESSEETEQRHFDDRLRASARRNNASFEVKNQRQATDRLRTLNSRATESNEQRERRIHCNALGNQTRIGAETFDARHYSTFPQIVIVHVAEVHILRCSEILLRHQDYAGSNGKVSPELPTTRTIEEFDGREPSKIERVL
ncbi:hypothetical protein AVEN_96308-1 [Araneus ventricosus]|uniref:Uncharacterized protein n=1 Tax=Araneus ventricosus TaxID=182803 RepID=A0A4Y2IQF9_ARAVE|nr:hypothetical protein AVEN_96308-1 [Araneus ventricosus]